MSQQRQMGQAQMATDLIWTCPNCKTEIVTKPVQGPFKVGFGCFFFFPFCYGTLKKDICPHCGKLKKSAVSEVKLAKEALQ